MAWHGMAWHGMDPRRHGMTWHGPPEDKVRCEAFPVINLRLGFRFNRGLWRRFLLGFLFGLLLGFVFGLLFGLLLGLGCSSKSKPQVTRGGANRRFVGGAPKRRSHDCWHKPISEAPGKRD